MLALQAVRQNSSWRALASGAIATVGLRFAANDLGGEAVEFWAWHGPLLGVLAIPVVFNDGAARGLRTIACRMLPMIAIVEAAIHPWRTPQLQPSLLLSYLALAALVSGAFWLRVRSAETLGAALATLAASALLYLEQGYMFLAGTALSGGRAWLAGGGALVLAALGISLLKMGAASAARQWLERMNRTLGGAGCEPP
jgi:hypothetical protein